MVGRERLDLSAKPITDRPQQRWGGDLVSEVTAQEAHHLPTHLQLGEIRDCVAALLVEGQALVDVHLARSGSCTHDWPAPCAPLRILPPTEDSPLTRRIAIAWPPKTGRIPLGHRWKQRNKSRTIIAVAARPRTGRGLLDDHPDRVRVSSITIPSRWLGRWRPVTRGEPAIQL